MSTPAPVGRIDVISDAICPWCYIGKRQLEKALPVLAAEGLAFDVLWHPFQLNPDMPAEGVERLGYRISKFGSEERSRALDARVTEAAAGVGLDFRLDRLTRTPNTVAAHRVVALAAELGAQDAVMELLFEAYFRNGVDLGDADALADVAASVGLDRDAVRALLGTDAGQDEVLRRDAMARQAGISGVPSFAMQGHVLFSGAQPAEEMVKAFRHAWGVLKARAA